MLKEVLKYCNDVESGTIPAGMHLKNAVSRFRKDLKRPEFEFREDAFMKVVKFIKRLKHFSGKFAKQSFTLQPFQLFIVANIYGFYLKNGKRRFQSVYIEMSRKQGKTALIAALSLYHLLADGEGDPEILIAANSREQAKIGFNLTRGFSNSLEKRMKDERKRLRKHHSDIHLLNPVREQTRYRDREVVGIIKNLAADSSKLDGYNCSLGVVDEYHSAKNSQVRDVLRSGMGNRINPLLITITTAGFDKTLPCYELRTVCTEIISGAKQDDSMFTVIYSMDDEDDWKDPANWIKSNPNLGVTVEEDFLHTQVQQAINSPADEVGIKTKNLNVWCDSVTVWIPDTYILQATKKLSIDNFKGESCWVGVDLASNTDLTAVSYLFVKNNTYYFICDYWVPADTIKGQVQRIHADKNLYKTWADHKFLQVTSGNVTDYDFISHSMLEVGEKVDIQKVYYDRYNANSWATQCTDAGLPLEPFSQVIANFNNPTREFERLILSGKVVIDDNPINRYCMRNVELRKDFNGNVKPLKDSERKKIDGTIAKLQSLAAYLDSGAEEKGIGIY